MISWHSWIGALLFLFEDRWFGASPISDLWLGSKIRRITWMYERHRGLDLRLSNLEATPDNVRHQRRYELSTWKRVVRVGATGSSDSGQVDNGHSLPLLTIAARRMRKVPTYSSPSLWWSITDTGNKNN